MGSDWVGDVLGRQRCDGSRDQTRQTFVEKHVVFENVFGNVCCVVKR